MAVVDQGFVNNTAFLATPENSSPALRFQGQQLVWPLDKCNGDKCVWDIPDDAVITRLLNNVRDPEIRKENYIKLNRDSCLENYSEGFMQRYSDVVVVSTETQPDDPVLWTRYRQSILNEDKMDTNQDPFH